MNALNRRQRALHTALVSASADKMTQLSLVYVYANRIGASERDVKAVQEHIIGGPVRDCPR